jgi:hypothetical protein
VPDSEDTQIEKNGQSHSRPISHLLPNQVTNTYVHEGYLRDVWLFRGPGGNLCGWQSWPNHRTQPAYRHQITKIWRRERDSNPHVNVVSTTCKSADDTKTVKSSDEPTNGAQMERKNRANGHDH